MSRFTDPLVVSPLPDGHTWVIKRDFGYDLFHEGSGCAIHVPVGFHTDFASVPRLFWMLIPRWGIYGNAAVIHDYLYVFQPCTRYLADAIFDEGMRVLRTPRWQRVMIITAVRLVAWVYWRKRRRALLAGIVDPVTGVADPHRSTSTAGSRRSTVSTNSPKSVLAQANQDRV